MNFDISVVLDVGTRLLPSWPPRTTVQITYLPGGYSNRNFRIDLTIGSYALRIVQGTPPGPHERRYLDILDIDVAPEVVAYEADTGHMMTRWIDGRLLAHDRPSPAEAGRYLAALHAAIPTGVREYDFATEIRSMLEDADADPDVVARFESLGWTAAERAGCHNDLNPWNVIHVPPDAGGGFRTLDWEFAGDNDRLFDLAGLSLGFEWTDAEISAAAAAYDATPTGQRQPLHASPARIAETVCAYRIREYAWAVAQIAEGNDREPIRKQAATMRELLLQD